MVSLDEMLLDSLRHGARVPMARLVSDTGAAPEVLAARLEHLCEQGLLLRGDPLLGYQLEPGFPLLDRAVILGGIPVPLADSLAWLQLRQVTDSTNSDALAWLKGGGTGMGLFLAEQQVAGRGRRGRHWTSPLARNIYLSLVWPCLEVARLQEGLSLVTALSIIRTLRDSGLAGMEGLQVKWPNDIWLAGGKLAGILLELQSLGRGAGHVVIGVGINISMRPADRAGIEQPVSDLVSQGNAGVDRNRLVAALLAQLDADLRLFASHGFAVFRNRWQEVDMLADQPVELSSGRVIRTGVARGVSEYGAIRVETATGLELITGGEVAPSVRIGMPAPRQPKS